MRSGRRRLEGLGNYLCIDSDEDGLKPVSSIFAIADGRDLTTMLIAVRLARSWSYHQFKPDWCY